MKLIVIVIFFGLFFGQVMAGFPTTARSMAMGGVGVALSNKADSVSLNPARIALNKAWGVNALGLGLNLTGSDSLQDDLLYIYHHKDDINSVKTDLFDFKFDERSSGSIDDQVNKAQNLVDQINKTLGVLDKVDNLLAHGVSIAKDSIELRTNVGIAAGFGNTGFMINNTTYVGLALNENLIKHVQNSFGTLGNVAKQLDTTARTFQKKLNAVYELLGKTPKTLPPLPKLGTSDAFVPPPIGGNQFFDSNLPPQICLLQLVCAQHKSVGGKDEYCINNDALNLHQCIPVTTDPKTKKKEVCFSGFGCITLAGGNNHQACFKDKNGKGVCLDDVVTTPGPGDNTPDSADILNQISKAKNQVDALKDLLDNEPAFEVLIVNKAEFGIPYSYAMPLGIGRLAVGITPKLQLFYLMDQKLFIRHLNFSLSGSKQVYAGNVDIGTAYEIENLPITKNRKLPGKVSLGLAIKDLVPMQFQSKLYSTFYVDPVATVGVGYSIWGISLETDMDLTSVRPPVSVDGSDLGFKSKYLAVGAEYNLFNYAAIRLGDRYDVLMHRNMYTAGISLLPLLHLNLSAGYAVSDYMVMFGVSVY